MRELYTIRGGLSSVPHVGTGYWVPVYMGAECQALCGLGGGIADHRRFAHTACTSTRIPYPMLSLVKNGTRTPTTTACFVLHYHQPHPELR